MADAKVEKECYKSLVKKLLRFVECPICLDTLKIPFKICSRGHSVCIGCIKPSENCPTCKESFVLENVICLKNVLEVLPKECCYSGEGCGEVVEPGNEHEIFCCYRPIACFVCREKSPIIQYEAHFKNHHGDNNYYFTTVEDYRIGPFQEIVYREPVFLFENLFWIVEKIDPQTEQLNVCFGMTPIKKEISDKHDYYVRVKYENGEFVYTHTMKAVLMNNVSEFEREGYFTTYTADERRCAMGKYSMKIPVSEQQNLINAEGELRCDYYFFKKAKLEVSI